MRQAAELVLRETHPALKAAAENAVGAKQLLELLERKVAGLQADFLASQGQGVPKYVVGRRGKWHCVLTASTTYCGWNWAASGAQARYGEPSASTERCTSCVGRLAG